MGQRQSQLKLHLHALGQGPDLLLLNQVENAAVMAVGFLIPLGIKGPGKVRNGPKGFPWIEGGPARGIANPRPYPWGIQRLPQNPDGAAVRVAQVQNCLYGGGFSRTVSAQKAHNLTGFQPEGDVFQGKARVALAQVGNLQNRLHKMAPFSSFPLLYRRLPGKSTSRDKHFGGKNVCPGCIFALPRL